VENALELPLKLPEPAVTPAEVEQLVSVLREAGNSQSLNPRTGRPRPPGWLTADEIAARMGNDTTDRFVREIASAACPAVVSYPGSPGYKLWKLCSVEEIDHCIEAIESQAKDMLKRAIMYRQAYHSRYRGPDVAPPQKALL
jgi:hypothetical protein